MTRLEMYLIALLVLGLALGGAYFYGRHDGQKLERERTESANLAARTQEMADLKSAVAGGAKLAEDTLKAVSGLRVVNRVINNEVQREIQNNVVYASECFAPDGRLLWNAANRGAVPIRPSPVLPAPAVPGTPSAGSPK